MRIPRAAGSASPNPVAFTSNNDNNNNNNHNNNNNNDNNNDGFVSVYHFRVH